MDTRVQELPSELLKVFRIEHSVRHHNFSTHLIEDQRNLDPSPNHSCFNERNEHDNYYDDHQKRNVLQRIFFIYHLLLRKTFFRLDKLQE